jgi:putative nucleotidyltransferase with HDIG domain/PAS domain S-box-containing protein
VSRVGGDEFAVILPETSSSEAAQIADRMAKALERPNGMTITTSIGFATLDLAEPTSKRLFSDADSGLYRAKANGRSCVASRLETQAGSPGDATGMVVDRAERRRRDRRLRTAVHLTSEALAMLDVLQSTSSVGLGFIDRDFRVIRINPMLAGIIGKSPEKVVGQAMDEVAPALWPRLEPSFRAVMDTGQPMCNEEIAGETAEDPGHLHFWLANHYPVMLEGHVEGIGIVVVDICDRKRLEESRALLTRAVVAALSSTVEMSDPYTAGHQKAVADIAVAIATELHVSADDIETIDLAARIHDLGKVAVPAELLSRPGRLRDAEMDLVRTHAQAGSDILEHVDFPAGVREIVLQHHERLDGSGYPQGLRGEQISIGARIVAVADVLEAMAAYRPYRPALGIEIARKELQKGSDSLYDAAVVDACVRLIEDGRIRETQSGQNLETLQIPARSDCRPQAPVGLAGIEQRADPVVPK